MEKGTVRVLSFRQRVRKVGIAYPADAEEEKSVFDKLSTSVKAKWIVITATFSTFLFGHRPGPAGEPESGDVSPTHLKSPIVVQQLWDQAASKYRYCGCVHVKVAAMFGLLLDWVLIVVYFVIITMVALDWEAATAMVRQEESAATTEVPVAVTSNNDTITTTLLKTTPALLTMENEFALSQLYESYLAATIADASMALVSLVCLMYGMAKNKPNFLIPEICLAFVIVGVKIIQLSKQASDGVATPFIISFGIVEIFFSLWFAHVVYLYRKYMKDRNAFLAAHTEY